MPQLLMENSHSRPGITQTPYPVQGLPRRNNERAPHTLSRERRATDRGQGSQGRDPAWSVWPIADNSPAAS